MDDAPSSAAREVLLTLYRENSAQARHYERQRQAVAHTVAVVAAIVVGLLTSRAPDVPARAGATLLPPAILLLVAGAFGFVASLRHHERARLHVARVHAVRRELSRCFPVDVQALYDAAAREHARRYPHLSERTARTHYVWQALHAAIAALGAGLALAVLAGGW